MRLNLLLEVVLILSGAGAIYAALSGATAFVIARRWGNNSGRAFWVTAALGILFLVTALAVFYTGAIYFRPDPRTGGERQGEDYFAFVTWAQIVFFALNAAALAFSATAGYVLGARLSGLATRVSLAAVLAMLVFALATLPITEFFNACYVGAPFILKPSC